MSTDVIWQNTVDQRTWDVRVVRLEPYKGRLLVTRLSDNEVIHTEDVVVSYDARFGPDMADVGDWAERAITAIDSFEEES